jgi:hypothetical protein
LIVGSEAKPCLITMADEDWEVDANHPHFIYGDRGYDPGEVVGFGGGGGKKKSKKWKKSRKRTFQESEPLVSVKISDAAARKAVLERGLGEPVQRPTLSLQRLREYLEGKHRFHIGKPSATDDQRGHATHFLAGHKLTTDHAVIKELVTNIKHFRVMVLDTEGKPNCDPTIFLIIGDLHGNVAMWNDAREVPDKIKELLADVTIYKIQSDIAKDREVLSTVGIRAQGCADSQVIFGSFVSNGAIGTGTVAQSESIGANPRPFKHDSMHFCCRNIRLDPESFLHAVMDARQPMLTLFKVVDLRIRTFDKLPTAYKQEDNVFDFLIDVLNRMAGVPKSAVHEGGRPFVPTIDENWKTGKEPLSGQLDLNCREEVLEIQEVQRQWKKNQKHRGNVFKKLY